MKTPLLIVLGMTSSAVLLPIAARAQSPSPAPSATPSVSAPAAAPATGATAPAAPAANERREGRKARLDALTPDERARLKAAHEKAMQDPAVIAAEPEKKTDHRAFEQAMHAAMLRADPTIGEVLAKLRPERGAGR